MKNYNNIGFEQSLLISLQSRKPPRFISEALSLNHDALPGSIEPGGRSQRPQHMRQTLATIFRLTGFILGLAAGGVLIALQWPDMMADLYSANAFRHFIKMFIFSFLFGGLIGWPFWWVADKLFPEVSGDSADIAPEAGTSPRKPRTMNECRHAD
jgi:hypothetical protein